ncbi:MAG: extracellular solute-binding protein [Lachnospira sp.]|nr:extracellular solute-binding protein [Lachnospira sp.]
MKTIIRRTAASLAAGVIAAGALAGCGNGGGSQTTGGAAASTAANSSSTTKAGESKASSGSRPTVTFSTIDFNAGASNTGDNAEKTLDAIKDYTNTDVQIQWIPTDTLDEKNSLAMQSPDTMPMIMTWNGAVTGNIVTWAKQGAFVDLSSYLSDSSKYPNLSKQNAQVAKSLSVNGKQFGIYRARVIGRYGLSYRKDWAEKLGLSEPKTIDDVEAMLKAFTEDDPDGDGQDDTVGMEMTSYTGPFDIMQTWFGCGNGWTEKDGKLIPVWQQDEYFTALDWFKKIYDAGYMPSDWATRQTDSWSDGCKKGQNGVYIDVLDGATRITDYFQKNDVKSVTNPDETAFMNLVGTINGKTMATSGYNGYFTLSAKTCNTPEKVEAALHFLDKMCDEDMMVLANYGLEGINYHMEDGNIVQDDLADKSLSANHNGLNQLVPYIPYTEPQNKTLKKTPQKKLETEVINANSEVAIMNPALPYLNSSATYASNGGQLDKDISAARTQYICGEIDKDGLNAAIQSAMDKGYSKIIDEVNEAYKADTAK